jgi:hypothetical protein
LHVSSKIVLEGEAGLGGEAERDVPELRDEKVNVFCGPDFSGVEKVRAWEGSLDTSQGRIWLVPDFVPFSMLPIRESSFGLCCGAVVEGDEGVPLLVWPVAFVCKSGGLVSGGCSGTERGIVFAIDAMLGVLTGLGRRGSCCDSFMGVEGGGGRLVSVTASGRVAIMVGDLGFCDTLELLVTAISKPMSSMLRGRDFGVEGVSGVVLC